MAVPSERPIKLIVDASAFVYGTPDLKEWTSTGLIKISVASEDVDRLLKLSAGSDFINKKAAEAFLFIKATKHSTLQLLSGSYKTWPEADQQGVLKSTVPNGSTYEELARRACQATEYKRKLATKKESDGNRLRLNGSPSSSSGRSLSSNSSFTHGSHGSDTSIENSQELRLDFNGKHFDTTEGDNNGIPRSVDTLLKAVIYRIHQESGDFGDETDYILVSVDQSTLKWAKKFGVPAKRLDQFRELIEEQKSADTASVEAKPEDSDHSDDGEERIVFVARKKRASAPNTPPARHSARNSLTTLPQLKEPVSDNSNASLRPTTPLAQSVISAQASASPRSSNHSRSPRPASSKSPRGGRQRGHQHRRQRSRNSPITNNVEAGNASSQSATTTTAAAAIAESESQTKPPTSPRQPPRGPRNNNHVRPSPEVYQPQGMQRGRRGNGRLVAHRPGSSGGYRGTTIAIPTEPIDPNDFSRGSVSTRDRQDVEYTLTSGAPRSAARGRGRLFIP